MGRGMMLVLMFLSNVMFSQGCSTISKMPEPNPFIGTWGLVTIEYRADDGTVSFPFGKSVTGYISYSEDGYMFGILQNDDRHDFPFGVSTDNASEEQAALRREFLSYCGRYEIQERKIVHHIEVSLYTDWFGASERTFAFDGDMLTLSTNPFQLDGKQTRTVAIWERI